MAPNHDAPADSSCLVVGDGPPLVVFPGLAPGPAKNRVSYLGLAHVTKRRVCVINRPTGLPRGLTMPELAARHAQLISERFDEPVDLMGASTGGVIALQLAVDHPKLVSRLIVVAAASWLGDEGRQKLRNYGDAVSRGQSGAKILASALFPPPWSWIAAPLMWASHKLNRGPMPTDMLATIDAEVGFDVTARLNQIKVPTLLVAGGRDRAFPLELVKATAAGIPNSKLIVYPRAGHLGAMINRHFGRDGASFLAEPINGPAR